MMNNEGKKYCEASDSATKNADYQGNNAAKEWGEEVFPLLSWYKADVVKKARVLVVGAGALGNEVLKNLALFGIGNITIVDFDTIEYSNLTRSILFREADADKGMLKAEVAARRVKEINPNINVRCICGKIGSDVGLGLIRKMDVVIACLDSRLARLQLNRLCMRADVPWVDGGIENLTGSVKVYQREKNCYECGLSENAKNKIFQQLSCAGIARRNEKIGRVPTTPVIASIIGAVQVQEAMKLIHKEELEHGVFSSLCGKWFSYEGMDVNAKVYESAAYSDDCPSHECWCNVKKITSLSADDTVAEALSIIKKELNVNNVEINLRNDKFVDKIIRRDDNVCYSPMLPESKIPAYIDQHYDLFTSRQSALYQNAFENIDDDFPYKNLSLKDVGIPYYDVIQLTTDNGCEYVELTADEYC